MNTTTQSSEKTAPPVVIHVDLRDYFAAKVAQGLAANPQWNITKQVQNCARESYVIADALLRARNQRA